MKKSLVLAGLLSVGSLVSAANIEYYVAAGAGKGYQTVKATVNGISSETSDNGGMGSISGGVLINDTHRVGLEYAKYNTSGSSSMYSVALGYDYRFHIKQSKFKPFIGLAYVRTKYSEDVVNDATTTWDKLSYDIDTNAIMGRVGVDYDINTNFYVSAMYDYAFSTSGDTNTGFTAGGTHYDANLEVDKLSRFQFLVGYKF